MKECRTCGQIGSHSAACPERSDAPAPAPTDALKDEDIDRLCGAWAETVFGGLVEWAKTPDGRWLYPDRETEREGLREFMRKFTATNAFLSASGLSRPGEGDEARFRQALETISALADDAPWSNETGRVKRMGTIARVELERRATPARSTAPSVLTEEECNFLLVLCSMIRRAIGDDPADRLLAIKRRLNARAFPDSTKETKS